MYVLNMGKKDLEEAFTVYKCDFCNFEGLVAKQGAKPYGHPNWLNHEIDFTEDIFEGPVVESVMGFDRYICPNCGKGMNKLKFKTKKEYAEYLIFKAVQVIKWNDDVEDYVLSDDDLYLRD